MTKISIQDTAQNRGAKTFPFIGGGNLGNNTMLMRMSQRELLDLCDVMNIDNIAADDTLAGTPHTQRRLYDDHAKSLAVYGLLGLIKITIEQYKTENKEISETILSIVPEMEGGDSSYQAFQPMVANLNCEPGGADLDINQKTVIDPITGKTEKLFDVYEVILSPKHRIQLLDGQHRKEGFSKIDRWLEDITRKGIYTKKGLYVPEGKALELTPDLISFWTDVYMHATYTATLSVEVHLGLSIQMQRQLFNDLNAKGKKVEISLQQDFDRGDAVNKVIMEELIGSSIPWKIKQKDQENWNEDDGGLIRKYLNPITALAMFGKPGTKGITPLKASRALINAKSFWGIISKIPNFGKAGAKANTVAAQAVVLKGIAKLFFDLGYGTKATKNEDEFKRLVNELRKIEFSHKNPLWGSLMMDNETRVENFPGIEEYVFVPKGTNLDAGTIDPDFKWVRYSMKHNDIYPRIGDLIRYQLKLTPRPSVTAAIKKEKDAS